MPALIEAAEQLLAAVDRDLQDPAVYQVAGRTRFDELTRQRQQLPARIQTLYARWEALEAIAEQSRVS